MAQTGFPMELCNSVTKVVGLTGGIGTGKSSVASFLRKMISTEYIDADQVCRKLLEPDKEGWHGLQRILGSDYFYKDQTVNRKKVRRLIFVDSDVRNQINNLLHPLAWEEIKSRIDTFKKACHLPVMLVEVPLLYEAGWESLFESIVVVYSRYCQCARRLSLRDDISGNEAEKALASQWSLSRKVMMADHVIDNSGSWALTCLEVLQLIRLLPGNTIR